MKEKKTINTKRQFSFVGRGPYSKSLLNRAWIVKSYYPYFEIIGSNPCEDIKIIEQAVSCLNESKPIFCGESGTALRFMALRASRKKGTHILSGKESLFLRPHQPLISILSQLGVEAYFENNQQLIIKSEGWKPQGDAITFSSEISSQFASALFLNSFELERDLFISMEGMEVSSSYLKMTLSFLKNLGFQIKGGFPEFQIPRQQKITKESYEVEPDMSCLFILSCFASISGQAVFTPWCENSIQPDRVFPSLLEKMGANIEIKNNVFKISSPKHIENKSQFNHAQSENLFLTHLKGISCDLNSCPDLFPSLAVLCSLSQGESLLYGAPHLKYKESDRIKMTTQLIQKINRPIQIREDGLFIEDLKEVGWSEKKIFFNPQSDHRMAMAAALLIYASFNVEIKNQDCVNKSFPEFWNIVNISSPTLK